MKENETHNTVRVGTIKNEATDMLRELVGICSGAKCPAVIELIFPSIYATVRIENRTHYDQDKKCILS
jgi:hypothetical protein